MAIRRALTTFIRIVVLVVLALATPAVFAPGAFAQVDFPQPAFAQTAFTQSQPPASAIEVPACHATTGLDTTLADMARADASFVDRAQSGAWICGEDGWKSSDPVAWLRFDKEVWEGGERPEYFYSRTARHRSIAIAALDADGTMRVARYGENDGRPFAAGPVFALDLPTITEDTSAVLVRIERPHSIPLLTEARLTSDLQYTGWSQLDMMLLALVLGMLVLPLLFDIGFYAVLREKFVVIHAGMVAMMMVYVLFAGGLISMFVTLPVAALAIVAPLSWAIGMGLSLLFFAHFVEPGAQPPLMRRITLATGWWTMIVPGFCALQFHATQPIDDPAYFLAFLPAFIVIPLSIAIAIRRGSRAARFLAVAWLPMILAGGERFARGMGVYVGPSTLDQLLYVSVAFEVIIIALAIADRFLALRQERDAAISEAQTLERLSERDPLTGLMNRRAVASRFETLRKEGFDTFALIDLDRFKDVNDRFGHQVGDRALVACAEAIRGGEEREEIAVRLGGEEFVVLLRGEDTLERAEALRQAIPVRIAREVEGLDRMVTASMGVVAIPNHGGSNHGGPKHGGSHHDGNAMDFGDLYARADKLLYEAKAAGRNRTTYEKLQVFRSAPAARPRVGEAARKAANEAA